MGSVDPPPLNFSDGSIRPPPPTSTPCAARGRLRRRHGHEPAAARPGRGGLRRARPRGLQRGTGRDPARPGGPGASLLLRGRLRRGRDRHLRLDLGRPGRVRAGRPGPRADAHGPPSWPARCATSSPRRAPALGGRFHGAGHQVPHPRADPLRRVPRRLRGAGARPARGRRRPPAHRDAVRHALGQGRHQRGPARHGGAGPLRARSRPR